jgi:hydroxymethylpyrimidine/phosphomethylpyrimidine kinase
LNDTQQAEIILGNLVRAINLLQDCPEFTALIPEVRVNLSCTLPGAKTPDKVAAVDGRITAVRGYPHASGLPQWGASDHMARLIIEVRRYDNTLNAGINFKCNTAIIEIVQKYGAEKGITFGGIDRTEEPEEVSGPDRSSMPWKIKQLVTKYNGIPRLFYEGEGWGKEPLFVALGSDAVEVAGIAADIAQRYRPRPG